MGERQVVCLASTLPRPQSWPGFICQVEPLVGDIVGNLVGEALLEVCVTTRAWYHHSREETPANCSHACKPLG